MVILTDTDFKATVLNVLKEIGSALKMDARSKNCKKVIAYLKEKRTRQQLKLKLSG